MFESGRCWTLLIHPHALHYSPTELLREYRVCFTVPPSITVQGVTEISVVESDGQTLTCQLEAEDGARVSWLHNGVPLAQTELEYTLRDDNSTLVSGRGGSVTDEHFSLNICR